MTEERKAGLLSKERDERIHRMIESFFEEKKWRYEMLENCVWRTSLGTNLKRFDILVYKASDNVLFINLLFLKLPERCPSVVFRELLEANNRNLQAFFSVDPEDDFVYVLASVFIDGLTYEQFNFALDDVCVVADREFPRIVKLLYELGDSGPKPGGGEGGGLLDEDIAEILIEEGGGALAVPRKLSNFRNDAGFA
ncbi:MAG: YbjN domain-containing protein [bacterium]|jgi:hypothetical protein